MSHGKAKRTGQRRAFTLVELMIVVGIILILASLGAAQYLEYRENARRAKCVTNLRAILMAKLAWHANNQSTTGLTGMGLQALCERGYFRGDKNKGNPPKCPSGGIYDWNYTVLDMPGLKPTCSKADELGHVLATRRAN